MAITPDMIREKSFKSQMRGYNVDEVDDFLDYVMVEVERLLEENANQRKQIDELVKKLKQGGGEGADHAEVESLRRQLEATRMRITALEKTPAPATAAAPSPDPALLKQLEEAKLRIRELEAKCADADEAREAAVKEARELVGNANVRVNAMVQDAELKTRKALAAMQVELDNTRDEYERMRTEIQGMKEKYREFLNAQMRLFIHGQEKQESE